MVIAEWADEGMNIPYEKFKNIRVEVDAFHGCDFTGCKVFDIDQEVFNDPIEFKSAFHDLEVMLDEVEVDDDPHGQMLDQIVKTCYAMVDSRSLCERPATKSLVMCAGQWLEGPDGHPVYDSLGNRRIDHTFDITVWVRPEFEEVTDED